VACRLIGGVALSGIVASVMAGVVKTGTPLNRTRNMALISQARNAGMACGPALGGLLGSVVSMQTAFAAVGSSLIISAAAFGRVYRDVSPGSGGAVGTPLQLFHTAFESWHSVLTKVPNVGMLCAMSAVTNGSIAGTNLTLLPLLLSEEPLSLSTGSIGTMLAANAAFAVVSGGWMGSAAQKMGPRAAIGAGTVAMSASLAIQPLVGEAPLVMVGLCGAQLGLGVLNPTLSAQIQELVTKQQPKLVMQAMSLQNTSAFVGLVAGASLGGTIGSQFGYVAGYHACSSVLIATGAVVALRFPAAKLP